MQQRRLAAIMFTDIVGYTALMGSDEKKAFEFLKKNRRIHWRLIKKYRGRWLKEMGDGILASFTSNIDAVMCALSIQKAAQEVKIPLRIGIHQGDVIFEKKDVLGDGVNIASRIQGVADTYGIVISETVFNDIKNKDGLETESLGPQSLKGVKSSVGIYKVSCHDNNILDYSIDTGELIQPLGLGRTPIIVGILIIAFLAYALYYFLPRIINPQSELGKSVLVLPFDNYTGSDTLEYFVAGMHNALIGDIGKISALRVISKTTANAYKDSDKSIPEIAAEQDVGAVIEASVLCFGDSVCLQVKLVSAYPEEQTLWVQDFYVEKSQILSLYNKVTKEISDEINVILTPQEENMLAEFRTVDIDAYDAYLKGMYYWEQLTPEAMEKALEYFNLAMEKDPTWAYPYAALAAWWVGVKQFGVVPSSIANPMIYENIDKALEMDPNSDFIRYVNGLIAVWTEWDWEKGEKEFLKVLEINPNHAFCRVYYAHLLMTLGRTDEAFEQGKLSLELDPLNPMIQGLFCLVLVDRGDYEEIKSLTSEIPDHPIKILAMEASYYEEGDFHNSFKMITLYLSQFYYDEETISNIEKIYEEKGYAAALEKIYFAFEEKAQNSFVMLTDRVLFCRKELNKPKKTLELLEKGFETNDGGMPYISTNVFRINYLKDNPRFIELLKKMNLPLE